MHQCIQYTHNALTITHIYNFRELHKFHVYNFIMLMMNFYNLYRIKKHIINIKIFILKLLIKLLNHQY